MPTMQFFPELKDFLREKGLIYTVRRFKMVRANVLILKVGGCLRDPIKQVYRIEDVAEYAEVSGFPTAEDWWKKLQSIIPRGAPMYLYKVSVLHADK